MNIPDRLVAAGAALLGVGGAGAVAYWIYGLEARPSKSFWQLPGFIALGVVLLGLGLLLTGLMVPVREQSGQVQRSGSHSTNVQAGGDVRMSSSDRKKQ